MEDKIKAKQEVGEEEQGQTFSSEKEPRRGHGDPMTDTDKPELMN